MILDETELKAKFKTKQRGKLIKLLNNNRVPFMTGAGGCILTTEEAITISMTKQKQTQGCVTHV
jgi:hypothetical protein